MRVNLTGSKSLLRKTSVRIGLSITVLMAVLAIPLYSLTVLAANEQIVSTGSATVMVGAPAAVDLSISGTGDEVLDLNLSVLTGELAFGQTTGLTFTGPQTGSVIQVSGLRSDLNAALDTLTLTVNEPGVQRVDAFIGGGDGEVYNPANGHVYRLVDASLPGVNWNDANAGATSLTYNGASGYLATITSEQENTFLTSRLAADGWIGASDADVEGEWRWTGGDEAGDQFWSGDAETGSAVDGAYSFWNNAEPNSGSGVIEEDCLLAVLNTGSEWNDFSCTDFQLQYSVVEFGAIGDLPLVAYDNFTVTVNAPAYSVATCSQLQAVDDNSIVDQFATITLTADIDCEGAEINPLFSTDPFQGFLDGNNFTIRNVVISNPASNTGLIAATTQTVEIHDLTLENFEVNGRSDTGALIGNGNGGYTISNVHVRNLDMTIDDASGAGGLIGDIDVEDGLTSTITNVSAEGQIALKNGDANSDIGGLIGMVEAQASEITIQEAYADVSIGMADDTSSGGDIGGLIGEVESDNDYTGGPATSVVLEDAYAWGDIEAPRSSGVGGLIGRVDVEYYDNTSTTIYIDSVYATGSILGEDQVGGVIGRIDDVSTSDDDTFYTITNSFAMGEVVSELNFVGGFVGSNEAQPDDIAFTNNFFDRTRTTQPICDGYENVTCTAVNESGSQPNYFVNNSSNAPLNAWDFGSVWKTQLYKSPVFQTSSISAANDRNGDGRVDTIQRNLLSRVSPITNKDVALQISRECGFTIDDLSAESAFSVQDPAYQYAEGLWDFEAECGDPGFTAHITLFYHDVSPEDIVLRKHNPNTGAYFTIPDAVVSTRDVYGSTVTTVEYFVADGGLLDIDGVVDGVIRDPAGIASLVVDAPNTGLQKQTTPWVFLPIATALIAQ